MESEWTEWKRENESEQKRNIEKLVCVLNVGYYTHAVCLSDLFLFFIFVSFGFVRLLISIPGRLQST